MGLVDSLRSISISQVADCVIFLRLKEVILVGLTVLDHFEPGLLFLELCSSLQDIVLSEVITLIFVNLVRLNQLLAAHARLEVLLGIVQFLRLERCLNVVLLFQELETVVLVLFQDLAMHLQVGVLCLGKLSLSV